MDPEAMTPHGRAMQAFINGDHDAQLIIHRDDGHTQPLPMAHFFRDPSAFTTIENTALDLCSGPALDVGAGSGLHTLELQGRGVSVTAIDISPEAVNIMGKRGVRDVHCADIFMYRGGPYCTMILLGHGIGIVETVAGLDRFLVHVRELLSDDGQILLDSLDVRNTDDPLHLAYHEANRQAGRYIGETRLEFEYGGIRGPSCGWLHIDADTLNEHARTTGWRCDVVMQESSGEYLARLVT